MSIPVDLLQRSKKILFIAHLALGDFTYLQSCFLALSKAYPDLSIHIWVDELRRTSDALQWPHLQKYALYDWLRECPWVGKIYDKTYSPQLFRESIAQAREEHYPIVVSFGLLNRPRYARLARELSPDGFVVGQTKPVHFGDVRTWLAYRKLDAAIPSYPKQSKHHISDIYAGWFEQLFSMQIPREQRFPVVSVPDRWKNYAQEQFSAWRIGASENAVFLNGFSKSEERSWSLTRVMELAGSLKADAKWDDAHLIVNVIPEKLAEARALFQRQELHAVHLFSADENFFQLPAILSRCDLVISVETAIMHLANAVHVPVIALMRQTSPEWVPIDAANSKILLVKTPKGWVNEISNEEVIAAMDAWQLSANLQSSTDHASS
jgi:ADP-heptose:LPS heptosyltransferase